MHKTVELYQKFVAQAGANPAALALTVGAFYGTPTDPTGAGVEAQALSQVLGCRTQDACEIFMSLLEPTHILRVRLREYLATH